MEETRNSPNGNNKMAIKGIGSVVLLGGALALASAFALRHDRRSSGEDSSTEINKMSEEDIIGEEEVEMDNDSTVVISDESFKLDYKAQVDNAAEEIRIDQTNEEKTILPLLGMVGEDEDNMEEKTHVEEQEREEIGGEAEENHDSSRLGENGLAKDVWEVKMMKYKVGLGGKKMEEERESGGLMKKEDSRIMIWMLLCFILLSSFSCSCFFHLSFAKLGLFLFLTLFLLEIYGYSPLIHHE